MELLLSRGLNFEKKVMGLHARKMCIAYTPPKILHVLLIVPEPQKRHFKKLMSVF